MILTVFCLAGTRWAAAGTPNSNPWAHPVAVVIVLMPGTTLPDWERMNAPHLHALISGSGSVGLMNTRTAHNAFGRTHGRDEPPDAAVLTLAAGARAASPTEHTTFYPAGMALAAPRSGSPFPGEERGWGREVSSITAGQLWARRMGLPVPASDIWVDPDWPKILRANQALGYSMRIGNLADGLRAAGIPITAVIPNSAAAGGYAPVLAAESNGTVHVSHEIPTVTDLKHAGLWCTDWTSDADLGIVLKRVHASGGMLIVLSPFVNDVAFREEDRLAPVLIWSDDGSDAIQGPLYSPTTRTGGLITNLDIASTLADRTGCRLPTVPFGHDVHYTGNGKFDAKVFRKHALDQRHGQEVLPYCAAFIGACLLLVLLGEFPAYRAPRVLRQLAEHRLAALSTICLTLVALVAATSTERFSIYAGLVAVNVLFVHRIGPRVAETPQPGFLGLLRSNIGLRFSVLAATFLIGDAAFAGRWTQWSLLSYSPIEGARYYGIGNEAMGMLAGAMLVVIAALWPRLSANVLSANVNQVASKHGGMPIQGSGHVTHLMKAGVFAIMILAVFVVGWPAMGAKAGGVIVLAGSFAVFLWVSSGRRFGFGGFAGAMFLGIVILGAMAIADAHHASETRSHLGAGINRIVYGGDGQAVDIITRKLAVEVKLAVRSLWALPMWVGLACLLLQRRRVLPEQRALADAGLTAALLCLLFNDAGVLACALCLSIVCSALAVPITGPAQPARA